MNDSQRAMRTWRIVRGSVLIVSVLLVIVVVVAQPGSRAHDLLTARHLETPTFSHPPATLSAGETLSRIWHDVKEQSNTGGRFLKSLIPTEAGAIWLSIIIAIVVGVDLSGKARGRNLEIGLLLIVGVLLFNVLRFFDFLNDPVYYQLMDWVFTGVVLASIALFARAMWRVFNASDACWRPNLPLRTLQLLTIVLLLLNALTVVIREPDDAGFYTNLGGQRLRERGMFPYGDRLITGSPAAAYGPVLFLAHVPFQWLLDPHGVNQESPNHALMPDQKYYLPAMQASQLATLTFHLLGVAALIFAVRRLAGDEIAWGLAALYCGSAYVLGVGGERELVNGLTFISHIAAPSLALTAFALMLASWPLLSGVFLALSVATVFYPLFFVPAWIGYYWHRRPELYRFVGGMALAAIVVGGPVLAFSRELEGQGRLSTIVRETLGHHQSSAGYGPTPFGFWGGRDDLRALLQDELIKGQAASTPMFMIVLAFAAYAFFPARRATPQQLALLSACAAILAVTWKILGTGVYVTWYYPFLLIGFFAHRPAGEPQAGEARS